MWRNRKVYCLVRNLSHNINIVGLIETIEFFKFNEKNNDWELTILTVMNLKKPVHIF